MDRILLQGELRDRLAKEEVWLTLIVTLCLLLFGHCSVDHHLVVARIGYGLVITANILIVDEIS